MSRPSARSWRRCALSSYLARCVYGTNALHFQAIQQGHADIAKIYAQNAIRKQNEKLNLLRLGSRLDAVSSRVQTAVTMRSVTGSMTNVVKGMDTAMKSMDLEKVRISAAAWCAACIFEGGWHADTGNSQISAVMDRFETQFEDLDVATGYYENATSSATAVATPQDDVDKLMSQVADEAGVELSQEMNSATPAKGIAAQPEEEREDKLGERLRALRASWGRYPRNMTCVLVPSATGGEQFQITISAE
jgi:charged multivesicular body protein 1